MSAEHDVNGLCLDVDVLNVTEVELVLIKIAVKRSGECHRYSCTPVQGHANEAALN